MGSHVKQTLCKFSTEFPECGLVFTLNCENSSITFFHQARAGWNLELEKGNRNIDLPFGSHKLRSAAVRGTEIGIPPDDFRSVRSLIRPVFVNDLSTT